MPMYCEHCGKPVEDGGAFCPHCGGKLSQAGGGKPKKQRHEKKARPPRAARDGGNPPASGGAEPPRPKRRKWPIVLLVVLAVLAGVIAWVVASMFPLDVSLHAPDLESSTTDGVFDEIAITIESNQPIMAVGYALDPEDTNDPSLYTEGAVEGGMRSKMLTIEDLSIPLGESELWIYVETLFGEKTWSRSLEFDLGYTAAPEEEALVEVEAGTQLVSNELLVIFRDGTSQSAAARLLGEYGGEIVGQVYFLNQYQVRFTGSGEDYINDLKARLEQEEIVEAVYYNLAIDVTSEYTPNDSRYDDWDVDAPDGNNWGLECIDAPGAWDYRDEMSVVRVGVIDSMLDYSHEDLRVNLSRTTILPTEDFTSLKSLADYYAEYEDTHQCISNPCVFCSQKSHGTHCAGIIGAAGNNDRGVCGVNWNTELYFTTWWYYTVPQDGQLAMTSTTNGWIYNVIYLAMSGCRVISVSVGSSQPSAVTPYEQSATEYYDRVIASLEDAGYDFVIAKSAGNDDDDASNYSLNRIMTGGDHARAHTIVVAAVEDSSSLFNRLTAWIGGFDRIYNIASYSDYGDLVDVAAPGSDIYSTVFGSDYANMSGTSMATPMVAGVASLLYSLSPNLTYDIVKTIVCCTGDEFCAKDQQIYTIVNARNAVEWVREYGTRVPELELPTVGFVTGLVQDAVTLAVIPDAAVVITNEQTQETFAGTVLEGTYYCLLDPGTYTMQFTAVGYLDETIYHVEVTEGVVSYNVLLNMAPDGTEEGTVSGRIVDAFDASAIANAELTIYRGINQTSGTPAARTMSGADGTYSISLEPGNYTICAAADGYLGGSATILSVAGENRGNQDCTLTPVLEDGELRIVLTWGEYPRDLDSHLVGPAPDGSTFHTYFSNKQYRYDGQLYDNLDVDDTTSYGPETTSVYVGLDGTYTFYVYNYTDRGSTDFSSLATSGAQVRLYIAGRSDPIVYNVPNERGTLWTVFSVTNGVVTPINDMRYHTGSSSEIGQ